MCSKTSSNDSDASQFLAIRSSSHRTSSFSSLSSISSNSSVSSYHDESPVFSPKSPFHRVPFSWEKLPGIPKRQLSTKNDSSTNLLPLPPAGNQFLYKKLTSQETFKKYNGGESFRKDPFFAALVECSKDHDRQHQHDPMFGKLSRITRGLSEGFAFVSISGSCKSACTVSDSTIFVPRSRKNDMIYGTSGRSSKNNTRFSSFVS